MVLCHDDSEPFLLIQLTDHFVEFADAFRIKGGCRFIENQYVRLFGKDGCDDEPLALTSGESRHLAVLKTFEMDFRERFFRAAADLFRWETMVFKCKCHFFPTVSVTICAL